MKDAKRAMNYEDALRKGLDIGAIRQLFVANIVAIVITIGLTITMRQLIVASSADAASHSEQTHAYMSVLNSIGIFYGHTLMRIAKNKGVFPIDRYASVGLNSSVASQAAYVTSQALLDYTRFSDKRFDSLWHDLNSDFKQMMNLGQGSDQFKSFLLAQKYEMEITIDQKADTFKQTMDGLTSIAIIVNSAVFEIIKMPDKNLISDTTDNVMLNIFLKNVLPNFLPLLSTMPQTLQATFSDIINGLASNVLAIYVVIVCLMVVAMAGSVFFFAAIIRTFRHVCQCLRDLKLEDIELRGSQLSYVSSLMELEKLHPQHIRILSTTGDSFAKKRRRTRVDDRQNKQRDVRVTLSASKSGKQRTGNAKASQSYYVFTLLTSMIVLALFYVGQFIFSGVIFSSLISKVNKLEVLYASQSNTLQLAGVLLHYRCAVLHATILGSTSQVRDSYFTKFNHTETKDSSKIADLVNSISRPLGYSSSDFDVATQHKLTAIMSSNVCLSLESLKSTAFLCDALDVQIPQKGMVQAFYHMKDNLVSWMNLINTGGQLQDYLRSPEYISFELALSQIYEPALEAVVRLLFEYIEFVLAVDIFNVETLITISITFIGLLSIVFTLLTFRDIFRVKDELSFTFRTISIDGVVDNQRIRVVFLRLFSLDNQYFA